MRAAQAIDLKSALEQYSEVNDLLTNLVQDVVSIDQADAELSSSDELVNQMRIPFQKFLSTQNHVVSVKLFLVYDSFLCKFELNNTCYFRVILCWTEKN